MDNFVVAAPGGLPKLGWYTWMVVLQMYSSDLGAYSACRGWLVL